MVDASRAKNRPPGFSTRHRARTMASQELVDDVAVDVAELGAQVHTGLKGKGPDGRTIEAFVRVYSV